MRSAFFRELERAAERDPRVHFVTADLGYGVVERFATRFPGRYLNVGVAEQNMTGIAAGLALTGKIVFTYSIANFPTLRCLEQIRNDVCYHRLSVKIVAVGGGYAYGSLGMTHHATEDLAILRALPNMTVIAPGDPAETELAVRAMIDTPGPCYLRLGRAGEPVVHDRAPRFELGKAIRMREGRDVTLISTGGMLRTACDAADRLAGEGIRARLLSMHTVKPLDERAVLSAARETGGVVTLEEHSIVGGLGSAVAEVLADAGAGVLFKRLGAPAEHASTAGSQEYLCRIGGLSPEGVVESVTRLLAPRAVSPARAACSQRVAARLALAEGGGQ